MDVVVVLASDSLHFVTSAPTGGSSLINELQPSSKGLREQFSLSTQNCHSWKVFLVPAWDTSFSVAHFVTTRAWFPLLPLFSFSGDKVMSSRHCWSKEYNLYRISLWGGFVWLQKLECNFGRKLPASRNWDFFKLHFSTVKLGDMNERQLVAAGLSVNRIRNVALAPLEFGLDISSSTSAGWISKIWPLCSTKVPLIPKHIKC